MTIQVGTLCLVVGLHELSGTTQTVIGPLQNCFWRCPVTAQQSEGMAYTISGPELRDGALWVARPRNLVPIAPPFAPAEVGIGLHVTGTP